MDHLKEVQWSEIRLMARQGLRHCEILRELWRLHDGHALSSTMVHRWMTATFTGRRNFTTTKPTGRPPKLTPAVLRAIKVATRAEPTITIWQLTHQFDLGQATVHKALRSVLKLRKRLCIFRLHNLTAANRRKRLQISRRLLGRMRHSPRWSSKVITADESWMYAYNPTRKQQSCTWLEVGEQRHEKLMLVAFWDSRGVVHREFVPQGRAVNAWLYRNILCRMRESVRRRHRDLWHNCCQQFWLQHDNAAAHRSLMVWRFCEQTNIKLVPHPPYSPDLAPSDFFLFARIKKELRGVCFPDVQALEVAVDTAIGNIPQFKFAHAMEASWRKRLLQCIREGGSYFEKWRHQARKAPDWWTVFELSFRNAPGLWTPSTLLSIDLSVWLWISVNFVGMFTSFSFGMVGKLLNTFLKSKSDFISFWPAVLKNSGPNRTDLVSSMGTSHWWAKCLAREKNLRIQQLRWIDDLGSVAKLKCWDLRPRD